METESSPSPITPVSEVMQPPAITPSPSPGLAGIPIIGPALSAPEAVAPPPPKNYAVVDSVEYLYAVQEIAPLMVQTRAERLTLNQRWLEISNTDKMQHDQNKKYNGRSQAYLPVSNRNFDTLVANLSKGLFPSDEYMDVTDLKDGVEGEGEEPQADPQSGAVADKGEDAKTVKTYLQWQFDSRIQLRRRMKPFLRDFVKYGNSILKIGWQPGDDNNPAGAWASARSIFNWYVYPQTVDIIEEAILVFEDMDVSRLKMEKMKREEKWKNVDEAMSAALASSDDQNLQASRLNSSESQKPVTSGSKHGELYRLSEIYTFMILADVDAKVPQPVRIVMANDSVPLEIVRNDMGLPYFVARSETEPGFFYGQGFGKKAQPFQYLVNDFANQTNDNGNYALNPITKMIPNNLVGPPKSLAPGVVMYVTDKDAITFDRPPAEQMQWGMMLIDRYMQQGQSLGGAPPQLQGSAGGKTATSSQILQRNALTPLQDVVEDLENDVMIPLVRAVWKLSNRYGTQEVMATVAGASVKVTPASIKLDADFRWLASSQSASSQQRAQQGIQLLGALNPILMQLMAQNGYKIDPVPLLKRIFTDAMGYRGFDQFISKLPPGMPQQVIPGQEPQPGAEGAPPSPVGTPGDRIRSALEQAAGGGTGDMVPGEGEAFNDVRQNSDELSAFEGSQS